MNNTIRLQRRGVSHTLESATPSGLHIELGYHEGGGYYYLDVTQKTERPGRLDSYSNQHNRLDVADLCSAMEAGSKILGCEIAPEIEAYCYANAWTLKTWPHIANDVYVTCARYNEYTDTVRHILNVCLISFDDDGRGVQFWDKANVKYTDEIVRALGLYNSDTKAHGRGVERKEWLAWLLGESIKDRGDETPVLSNTMCC